MMVEVLDAQTRINDLLFIAGHLIDVLEKENAALAHNRVEVVRDLLEQKTKLSRAYEIRVLGLVRSPDDLDGVERAELEELKRLGDRIQELVEVNAHELSINITVGRHFMEALTDSVKETTPTAGTYNATGTTGWDAVSKHTKTTSLAINEQL